ncbi:MAG: hypothetical protein E7665_08605 [Ruminococcaceae bacterium]|nr:hypothetical protein [Oscillospiraceae bacterium]
MSYVIKNKKLFAVIMLVVMMSSVLVLPASAALNYGMGGVSYTDANGVQYAEGYIWNSYDNPYELNGRLESDTQHSMCVVLFARAIDLQALSVFEEDVLFSMDGGYRYSTWANATLTLDEQRYHPYQASADFIVDGVLKTYDYSGGWNWG